MAFLYQIKPDGLPGDHWVVGDVPVVVGREEPADAQVDDEALSRTHFLVVREGQEYFLVDLNSSNGTWVNGRRVSALRLKSGEIICAGESAFCFERAPLPAGALIPVHLLKRSEAASSQPRAV